MDAEAVKDQPSKTFTTNAVGVLLEHVAEQQCQAFDAVCLGEDLRFEADDVLGQGLRVEGHLLHLSVFPPIVDGAHEFGPDLRIQPPSSRRRRP
jgi:hypothetical protein